MHYGVDYYPEHEVEARWAIDARLMAEAGFTVVRLAEFAWARLEPQAGVFTFEWLDRVIRVLEAHGLQVVLGTPTAAPPQWLAAAHPEILYVDIQGQRAAPQSRRFVCLNSLVFRDASTRIVTAMAERYGEHPAVIAWQIDNEFGCHGTTRCYCPTCQSAFRVWLQQRYKTLDTLNTAWGTVFWSQEYSDWEQISLPAPTPSYHNPGHLLDAYRFASDSVCDYQNIQLSILRAHSPRRPIFHNLMANFDELDYGALTASLDLVAWDCYAPDGVQWDDTARYHDLMRGFKHLPFWVVESPPGQVNWTRFNPDLRPGEARLRTLQAVAHGADAVFYFHWRAFRGGGEQYHSAILPQDGIPGRAYHEATALGDEFMRLRPLLEGTQVQAEVAIIHDMPSYWALQYQPQSELLASPEEYVRPWYQELRRRNVAVEFCQATDDLDRYRLVIAPALHVLTPTAANNLQRFVERGGALILGPRTGFKEAGNKVTELPLPGLLGELAGVRVAEWAALLPGERRYVRGEADLHGRYEVSLWRELLELRTAQPLACYEGGTDDGAVAIATHQFGLGETWYVGALGAEFIKAVVAARLASLRIEGVVETPKGVEACERIGVGRRVLFLLNHTDVEQLVQIPQDYTRSADNQATHNAARLAPFDVQVFERQDKLLELVRPERIMSEGDTSGRS